MKNKNFAIHFLDLISIISLSILIISFIYIVGLTVGHSLFTLSDKWYTSLELPIELEGLEKAYPVNSKNLDVEIKQIQVHQAELELIPKNNPKLWQIGFNVYALFYLGLIIYLLLLFKQGLNSIKKKEAFGRLVISNTHSATIICLVLGIIPVIPQYIIHNQFGHQFDLLNGKIPTLNLFSSLKFEFIIAALILAVLTELFKEAKHLSDLEKLTV